MLRLMPTTLRYVVIVDAAAAAMITLQRDAAHSALLYCVICYAQWSIRHTRACLMLRRDTGYCYAMALLRCALPPFAAVAIIATMPLLRFSRCYKGDERRDDKMR